MGQHVNAQNEIDSEYVKAVAKYNPHFLNEKTKSSLLIKILIFK